MIVALLPQRVIDMTGSVSAVGYLTAIFAISYMLVQIPSGMLSDKLGYKFFLIWGYLFCGLAGILYYAPGGVTHTYWGRFFQGMGESPIWALAPALLSRHYPREKGKIMGMYTAALHAGLGMLLIGLWLFLASLGLGGFSLAALAWLNESVPDELKGTISGAYYLFWGGGYFSGPLFISLIGERTSFHTSFDLFACILVMEAIILVFSIKHFRKLSETMADEN